MQIEELRIYAECLEQGLDFKEYFLNINANLKIKNIYPTKARGSLLESDSILQKITKLKDFDIVISIISHSKELPILLVEYSTAVPTDDHKMQRSDVYFWASIFKIPVLKISPLSKDSSGKHGGGDKITLLQEVNLALQQKALVYFIDWKSKNSVLVTNPKRLSCIAYNEEIYNILKNLIFNVEKYNDFTEIYEKLLSEQIKFFDLKQIESLKDNFTDSTRFQRQDNKLIVKINRFGHAMDPDRGILFFVSMLFGIESIATKFIIKRERKSGKESYDTLFDGFSKPLRQSLNTLVEELENNPNANNALKLFQTAINDDIFELRKIDSKRYEIVDESLKIFLEYYTSLTYKSIFLTSEKLLLCDYQHNILCELSWNANIVKEYLSTLCFANNMPLILYPLSFKSAKEDIITYASVQILQKLGCDILSVSYPGAQGDRAILIGQGRQTKRIYLDILAYKNTQKCFVLLHENKERQNELQKDEQKLLNLKDYHLDSIQTLFNRLEHDSIFAQNELYLGLGSKISKNNSLFSPLFGVDYIFSFDINSCEAYTNILYNVALINLDLLEFFKPLVNKNNKMQGQMMLDIIYKS